MLGGALAAVVLSLLVACSSPGQSPTPDSTQLARALTFYDWAGDLIESVFEDFAEEYGIEAEGLLARIDYRNVPNFNHVSANFRDLVYDPGNKHSIPYSWGTTGLVVRTDLVEEPVTSWSDMWDPRYSGKVVEWLIPRYTLGAALKSLGYSINSEDAGELEDALQHLVDLKPNAIWLKS